jgi:hypothetical protein
MASEKVAHIYEFTLNPMFKLSYTGIPHNSKKSCELLHPTRFLEINSKINLALLPWAINVSKKEEYLPKYVSRFDNSGPIDYYVCELCKGRVNPAYFEYHLQTVHLEVLKK